VKERKKERERERGLKSAGLAFKNIKSNFKSCFLRLKIIFGNSLELVSM
jgi:hypothetical protein